MTGIVLLVKNTITIDLLLDVLEKAGLLPFESSKERYVVNNDKREYVAIFDFPNDDIKMEYSEERLEFIFKAIPNCKMYLIEYSDELFLKEILEMFYPVLPTNSMIEYDEGEAILFKTYLENFKV